MGRRNKSNKMTKKFDDKKLSYPLFVSLFEIVLLLFKKMIIVNGQMQQVK